MKPSDFKIGQKLWFVAGHSYSRGNTGGVEHVVKAVGRKWVTAGELGADCHNSRFDPLQSMAADGGDYSSPGMYYLERRHYEDEKERDALVDTIRRSVGSISRCPHISLDAARRIMAILDEAKS